MTSKIERPNPDELLASIQKQDLQKKRGKLKIFLGYVAGVGKTYAMLEAAHQRLQEGVDVAVAFVETHGRKETEAMLEGLQVIPAWQVQYRGMAMREMDLNAVLKAHPQLALVDELAHTNAPGSRHPKRYQDVIEILGAGIDVYTTVNIQHLESLKDVIQQITGVVVRETVPDSLVDEAYEIELIDLPTDELLQRLRDGKVYVPDSAAQALEKFFRKGNLTALRELSMRRAADRVDNQMLDYMQTESIPGPWPAGEKILVCISTHPMGERLIRAGRRLADDLNAEWFVLFVETPGHLNLPARNKERIQRNLKTAEEMGGRVFDIPGNTIAEEVLAFAHEHNITKIIVGKPIRPRWFELIRGSVIDQLIRNSGMIDVYVVSEKEELTEKNNASTWLPHRPWSRYLLSMVFVALMTLIGFPLHKFLDPTNLVMIYLAAVVLSATLLGRGPSILASLLGVLAFDFFFVDPRLSFTVADTQYFLTFGGLLIVGLIISNSSALLREQVDALRKINKQSQLVNDLSRELTGAVSLDQVLQTAINTIHESFNREVVVLLPQNNNLVMKTATPGFKVDESEKAIADWAFKNNKPAGNGTDTLPAALIRFTPLITAHGIVGILGIKSDNPENLLTLDQRILLEGFANLSALAIERATLADATARNEMLNRTEKLQTALLNSISHELRTPLATITGVLSSLGESEKSKDVNEKLDSSTKIELVESATRQAKQLNRIVENLLEMTRIEAGTVHVNSELSDVRDLIGSILNQMAERLSHHKVRVNIPIDIKLIPMDSVLIGQVLNNILDNACKYSPAGSPIEVSVEMNDNNALVHIKDQGVGIPEEDLERVFDKFYRVQRESQVNGTGLGLSICKGIIEAHEGHIWANNNSDRGATITFSLPV